MCSLKMNSHTWQALPWFVPCFFQLTSDLEIFSNMQAVPHSLFDSLCNWSPSDGYLGYAQHFLLQTVLQ